MDGLRDLARTLFKKQKFRDPNSIRPFDVFEISHDSTSNNNTVLESQLATWARKFSSPIPNDENHSHLDARIGIVSVHRELDVSLIISKPVFEMLLREMRVHEAALYMIVRDYDGFHEFRSEKIDNDDQSLPTWFVGTHLFALLWTFNPETSRTIAVFINRRRNLFVPFTRCLEAFKNYAFSPYLFCFVICVHLLHVYDEDSNGFALQTLREVENSTGYQPGKDQFYDPRQGTKHDFDVKRALEWTRSVGVVAGDSRYKVRHQSILSVLLKEVDALCNTAKKAYSGEENSEAMSRSQLSDKSLMALGRAVPIMQRHLSTYNDYVSYVQARAEHLSGQLYTATSVKHAAASVRQADAALKDSAAMKAIAFMTMFFLPGTFFAALFAVPTLNWDKTHVVGNKFWVYWAFTIPTTLFVIMLWRVLAHQDLSMLLWKFVKNV